MVAFRTIGDPPRAWTKACAGDAQWRVAEEIPVAFVYNRRNYAVMLATPEDLEDFAIGFSLTERVVDELADIESVDIHCSGRGVELHFTIDAKKLERLDVRQQRRNLVGRAGCGVCGLENADGFFEPLPAVSETLASVNQVAIARAFEALPAVQRLNIETRTVHAAAWVSSAGDIQAVREDVGRHNALDKLLGALARATADCADGFVLMSSRCSYEIIEKAARRGVRALASISAPTAFALRKATEANMAIYARAGDAFVPISGAP